MSEAAIQHESASGEPPAGRQDAGTQAPAALQARERLLHNIIEQNPHPIWISDAAGTLVRVNRACCALLHIREEEVLGKYNVLQDNLVREQGHLPAVQAVLQKGQTARFVLEYDTSRLELLRLERSARVTLEVTISAVKDEHGTITNAVFMHHDITQRRQAEDELRESERKYRALSQEFRAMLGAIPGSSVLISPELKIVWANEFAAKSLGLSAGEFLGQPCYRCRHERAEPCDPCPVQRCFASGKPEAGEGETRDGRTWELRTAPLFGDHGEVKGVIELAHDVTEKRRALRELQASEATLRSVFRATPIGITFNVQRVIVNVNQSMCDLIGYREAELLGQSARLFYVSEEEFAAAGPLLYGSLAQKGHSQVETRFRRKDGALIDVRLCSAMLRPEDPAAGYVVTVQDISEQKRAEDAIRAAAREWQTTFDAVNDAIWMLDGEFRIVRANAATARHFGRTPAEAAGRHCWEIVHGTDQPIPECPVRRMVVSKHREAMELRSGQRWLSVTVDPILDGTGTLRGVVHSVSDITERKAAEEERAALEAQLRQAQKMEAIGQLAGGVAHDFNNILTAVFGYVELSLAELQSGRTAAPKTLDGLQQIQRSAERASALTRQLLAFSRRQVLRPKVLNLNATMGELQKMLHRLITENIELELVRAPDLPLVEADPGQLEQVIVNLVVNARDAMPEGGRLLLETGTATLDEAYVVRHPEAHPGQHVMLSVNDTGCGMDAATRERIFEPFFTTKPLGQGTGLGLSTVYGIVKQAGGHICVYSEPGQGTTFKVYLPSVQQAVVATQDVRAAATAPVGTETVLLCEDDPAVRDLTVRLLADAGFTVLAAEDAGQALRVAAAQPGRIDLLLTDVVMPDMNGPKLAEALKTQRPEIKTLFMSGYTSNMIARHGVLEKNVEFLEKPFNRRDLLRRVREVLDGDDTREGQPPAAVGGVRRGSAPAERVPDE